jgi:hypothetical protein
MMNEEVFGDNLDEQQHEVTPLVNAIRARRAEAVRWHDAENPPAMATDEDYRNENADYDTAIEEM